MRMIYSLLFYMILPFIMLRLLWRSRRIPAYRQRLGERLGYYPFQLKHSLWVHAVSVGESLAAIPLIQALHKRYPQIPIVVTTMTPTGAARVKDALGDLVQHAYIPYDTPGAVKRFLNATQPIAGIIMETELWPNLLTICQRRDIPMCLINARLSAKSLRGYQRVRGLARDMLRTLKVIAAHAAQDAERFIALGATRNDVVVTGNLKFDIALPQALESDATTLRDALGNARFIWIAASTHEGEEEIVLAAHQLLRMQLPDALLILSPRHPDRFDQVAKLCEQSFITQRRSQNACCTLETGVYLGDTMGELLRLYGAADVAFVGGSLIARGGHNILEPGALAKPILTGPHMMNFAEISQLFASANALRMVNDAASLAAALLSLNHDPKERMAMGQRALAVVDRNRGALSKQLDLINQCIVMPRGANAYAEGHEKTP